jgi:pyridoxal phosphate enzyme (YggS family)
VTLVSPDTIAERLRAVHDHMATAALASNRNPAEVKLVAISKHHPREAVDAALAAGQLAFGENTLQDALRKIPYCRHPDIEWHFVGHLQSNKAKSIPQHFAWLHSLDSFTTAIRLAQAAAEAPRPLRVLVQVNITADANKSGLAPGALFAFIEQLLRADLAGLHLRGLMTIGPQGGDEIVLRHAFAGLRELRDACRTRFDLPSFTELSMGMSEDFIPAIREGATLIRIGSAIFGARPPKTGAP